MANSDCYKLIYSRVVRFRSAVRARSRWVITYHSSSAAAVFAHGEIMRLALSVAAACTRMIRCMIAIVIGDIDKNLKKGYKNAKRHI